MPEQTTPRPFATELNDLETLIERLQTRQNKSRALNITLTNLETAKLWLREAGKPEDG